ncbi:MAG: DNA ligase [Theionarchaea archaeon]|nr:DNA ligase [Theionarchaea archaeon]
MVQVTPMLARSHHPFSDADWIFEVKWDGTRAVCFINKKVKLINRRHTDITHRYPELQTIKDRITASSCILDGEIVVLKKGLPSFHDLQKREIDNPLKISILSKQIPAVYVVFDIMALNGKDITKEPLLERKTCLRRITTDSSYIMVSPYIKGKGKEYFEAATEKGFEGVMAKNIHSLYYPGQRSAFWLKIKKTNTQDCVVGGFTEGEGARKAYFGALLLGVNQPLEFIGKVGTGFSDEDLKAITVLLKKTETGENPFLQEIKRGNIHFVNPLHVCEVKYLELTRSRKLRAPVFVRWRHDKAPEECIL